MKNEFIPYEQALALKELGFDEECFGLYHNDKTFYPTQCKSHKQFYGQICSAPLYQQAFRWFRENHNINGEVSKNDKEMIDYVANRGETYLPLYRWSYCKDNSVTGGSANTYEEAELACLNKLIEIVKK